MKKRLACLLAATALAGPAFASDPPTDFVGRVAPQLALEPGMQMPLKLTSQTAEQAATLPAPLAAGDRAYEGALSSPLPKPVRVVLVRPQKGESFLYFDRNQDGKLSTDERFVLPPAAQKDAHVKGVAVSLPLAKGPFSSLPLEFFDLPDSELATMPPPMKAHADAILMVACFSFIEGRVPVDGKELLVRVLAAGGPEALDLRNATIQMDVNGDGKINPTGIETEVARGEDVLFRIGERYLSVRSIDLATGAMVLRSHPASDYLGFDLTPGKVVPDFAFVDLDGKPHKLSDWHGRHVLLDFWATWCAPCVAEFPQLKKAYAQYQPRGFEIVGVLYFDDDDRARKFLADPAQQLPWLQASAKSMEVVVGKRFRIHSVPATILLDPQGKVISTGEPGEPELRGDKLSATLARLFSGQDPDKPARP